MAVVGIPVKQILLGAYEVACDSGWDHALPDYAILRYLMLQKGKEIEIFESYEPLFQYFAEWLKQLFGESEGKDDTGLFPASLGFTTDLHSMGQFLQGGSPIFFETILDLENPPGDVLLPSDEDPSMAGIEGKTMNQINRAALQGVMNAHQQRGVPMVKINIPSMSPRILGQLFYFFQTTCAITASLMGVDPFNQPGVEAYKAEMKKELEK
jgi:glucose-6-phosphate isomerase